MTKRAKKFFKALLNLLKNFPEVCPEKNKAVEAACVEIVARRDEIIPFQGMMGVLPVRF